MKGYVIVDVKIRDHAAYEEYKRLTPESVAAYGGRFVVRGGKADMLEGEWQPNRIVVLEFPSVDQAKKWWDSGEYLKAKRIRQRAATTNMIVVEGAD